MKVTHGMECDLKHIINRAIVPNDAWFVAINFGAQDVIDTTM